MSVLGKVSLNNESNPVNPWTKARVSSISVSEERECRVYIDNTCRTVVHVDPTPVFTTVM